MDYLLTHQFTSEELVILCRLSKLGPCEDDVEDGWNGWNGWNAGCLFLVVLPESEWYPLLN